MIFINIDALTFTLYSKTLKVLQLKKKYMISCKATINNGVGGHCGRDRMIVGFITTYAISAYHH